MDLSQTNKPANNIIANAASFVSILLKGVGQIMLQENQRTGLIFLAGIFYGSFQMGVAVVIATFWGTITAILLKYDRAAIRKGLYGFNAALVGAGLLLFLKPAFSTWLLIVAGASLSTLLQHFFIKRKIAVFTLPFVLVTWVLFLFTKLCLRELMLHSLPAAAQLFHFPSFCFSGFAQVIFQANIVSGILFFIAVGISSPVAALFGFAGSLLSAAIAGLFSVPLNEIGLGLYSYNAVLCAIVFAKKDWNHVYWAFLAVSLSSFLMMAMVQLKWIPLTFPFVLATCMTLYIKHVRNGRYQSSHKI